jgi:hypothetical protein
MICYTDYMNQKGFSPIIVLLILVVIVIGVGVWYWADHQSLSEPNAAISQVSLPTSTQPALSVQTSTATAQPTSSTAVVASSTTSEANQSSPNQGILFLRNGDVWLANVDGSNQRQLTHNGFVSGYAYAPLAETIAYYSVNVSSTSALIQVQSLNINVGVQKTVYELRGGAYVGPEGYTDYDSYMLSISPDGRYIAFGGELFTGPSIAVLSQTPIVPTGTLAMLYDANSNNYISLMPPAFGSDESFDDEFVGGGGVFPYNWPLSFSPDSSMLLVGGTDLAATATVDLYSLAQNTTTILGVSISSSSLDEMNDYIGLGWQWASGEDTLDYQFSAEGSGTPITVNFNNVGIGTIVPTATNTIVNVQEGQKLYGVACDDCISIRNGKALYTDAVPGVYNSTSGTVTAASLNISIMNLDGTGIKEVIDNGDEPRWFY